MTERRPPRGRIWRALLPLLLVSGLSCRGGPVGPEIPTLEVVVAGGDGQFGTVGQILPAPLHAVVRVAETGLPRKDVTLSWEVEAGDARLVGSPATVTDSTGSAYARVELGAQPGDVFIRATVVEQESASIGFQAFAVDRPELATISVATAGSGDTITLTGSNFSPVAEHNVVLFSGVRGRVLAAQTSELSVEVPACLPTRTVIVTVQLGAVASQALSLIINGGGMVEVLAVGDVVDVVDEAGFTCLRLAGGPGVRYLSLVVSAGTVGAARHDFVLTGLADPGPIVAPPAPVTRPGRVDRPLDDLQLAWHDRVRMAEAALLRSPRAATGPVAVAPPQRVPTLGESRTFKVLTADLQNFEDVVAVVRHVGSEAVLYVDEASPLSGFTATELAEFADRFDDVIHPTVTGAFGAASDLDGNERIAVLFTPVVNRHTPRGSQGFAGGFFFGLDLLPGDNSNSGEVFYLLVPDPLGEHSDPRSRAQVLTVTPAILAHEFQHMVSFNERVLVLGASGAEALWLSEGMAQMAEELVARAYQELGDPASVELFRGGNLFRARRYLEDPPPVSLIVATGQGTLEERGAGWLHTLYLVDRFGSAILLVLTRTTRTGVANVTAATGLAWPELTTDWWSALYLDGIGPEDGRMEYPGLDLRTLIDGGKFPLIPDEIGAVDFSVAASLWSSSAAYYIVEPPQGGSLALRLGGGSGGASTPESALRLRLVRLQ